MSYVEIELSSEFWNIRFICDIRRQWRWFSANYYCC